MPVDRLSAQSFGVQYVDGPDALSAAELAGVAHEALILEPLNYAAYDAAGIAAGAADVAAMQAGGRQVFLYMSVGETSDLRGWWNAAWTADGTDTGARTGAAPDFVSDWFSGASGGQARLVQYWTAEWLAAIKSEIDFLIGDLGADGLFLDNVASYFEWLTFDQSDTAARPADDPGWTAAQYASAMSDLVVAVSDYARSINPDAQIIANGNPFLPFDTGDFAGKGVAFLDAISAMMQEGVYHSGGERIDNAARGALRDVVLAAGVPVLALDYIDQLDGAKIADFTRDAARDGFLAHAEDLDLALDGLRPALNQPTEAADALFLGPQSGTLDALGGDDVITGSTGDDAVRPGSGDDTVTGEGGTDAVHYAGTRAATFVSATLRDDGGVNLVTAAEGTDVLHDIATIVFDDQTVSLADLLAAGPNGTVTAANAFMQSGRLVVQWQAANDGDARFIAPSVIEVVPVGGGDGFEASGFLHDLAPGAATSHIRDLDLPAGFAPGDYTVRVVLDRAGAVAETDEDDNLATAPLTVRAANGAVTAFSVTPSIGPGEGFDVAWTLANDGNLALAAAEIGFAVTPAGGGPAIPYGPTATGAVAAGGTEDGAATFDFFPGFASGDYVVTARFDPGGAVPEADEDDNAATAPMTIAGLPDGAVSALSLGAATTEAGGSLTLFWTLDNLGGDPLGAAEIAFRIAPTAGGAAQALGVRATPALAAGAAADGSATLALPGGLGAGAYAVFAVFDPTNAVAELDEDANARAAPLTLTPPPGPVFTGGADKVTLTGPGEWRALGGDDEVTGGDWRDVIFGQGGDDLLRGAGGDDRLLGYAGRDRLLGGTGRDEMRGGGGADMLWGGGGADLMRGGAGRDDLLGEGGADRLHGDAMADFLDGGVGDDHLWGGAGADELVGAAGRDALVGGGGADILDGGAGADALSGGAGADLLRGGGGRDRLSGGTGDDRLFGGAHGDALFGGGGDDRLAGGAGADRLTGGLGRDVFAFAPGGGADTVTDFRFGDRLDVSAFRFAGAEAALQRVARDGADTVIALGGGDRVRLEGVRPASLEADDLIL